MTEDEVLIERVRPLLGGWALVEPAGIQSEENLKTWVGEAAAFAASLPAK